MVSGKTVSVPELVLVATTSEVARYLKVTGKVTLEESDAREVTFALVIVYWTLGTVAETVI